MATSGTTTYGETLNSIINAAYEAAGKKDTLSAAVDSVLYDKARRELNRIVKNWQASGCFIWKMAFATLFLAPGTSEYTLGAVNAAKKYTTTTLSVAAISGAGSITVASAAGLAIGQNIGILRTDNALQWFTITNVVGLVVTLSGTLASAAALGNAVYAYANAERLARPLDVAGVKLITGPGGEVQLTRLNRERFFGQQFSTTTPSTPVQWYFQQAKTASSLALLRLTPPPLDSVPFLVLDVKEIVEDFNVGDNEPDFPAEWFDALVLGLAYRIARQRGNYDGLDSLKADADEAYFRAATADREPFVQYSIEGM